MVEEPGRAPEVVAGRPEAPPENTRERGTGWEGGLRAASWAVARGSAGALVGGGIGMLVGVALGAINPFALGSMGAVVGLCVPVLLAVGARGAARRPWWRRVLGR